MTSKEELTIEQLEYYRNTYERYDGIESNIFEQICNELIDFKKSKTSTLSDCIKEWKERGWIQSKSALDDYGWFYFTKGEAEIAFYPNEKTYDCDCNYELEIDVDLHNLIGKTLKAMEVENNVLV